MLFSLVFVWNDRFKVATIARTTGSPRLIRLIRVEQEGKGGRRFNKNMQVSLVDCRNTGQRRDILTFDAGCRVDEPRNP